MENIKALIRLKHPELKDVKIMDILNLYLKMAEEYLQAPIH